MKAVESRQPVYLQLPSSRLATDRKLSACSSVHPQYMCGHVPVSYVAAELYSANLLSVQPPI